MLDDLKDKVVLITGSGTGIGAAAALAFARQSAQVMLHYNASAAAARRTADAISAAGGTAATIAADLTQAGAAEQVVQATTSRFGGVDVLINNAGAMLGRVPTLSATDAHFDAVIRLNCWSLFAMTRACVPALRQRANASIINVTSIAARNGGSDGAVLYASAKGFVSTLTRGLSKDLAKDGIRVNAIAPGVIDTPFHERDSSPAFMESVRSSIPLGRVGSPDECAGAFLYLACPSLSGYVTGQIIEINGGQLMP